MPERVLATIMLHSNWVLQRLLSLGTTYKDVNGASGKRQVAHSSRELPSSLGLEEVKNKKITRNQRWSLTKTVAFITEKHLTSSDLAWTESV